MIGYIHKFKFKIASLPLSGLNFAYLKGPFEILCQLGKIKNTKGHEYENRDRCRAIC